MSFTTASPLRFPPGGRLIRRRFQYSIFHFQFSIEKKPAEAGFFSISSDFLKFDIRESFDSFSETVVTDCRVDQQRVFLAPVRHVVLDGRVPSDQLVVLRLRSRGVDLTVPGDDEESGVYIV